MTDSADAEGHHAIAARQEALRADAEVAIAFGEGHPDTFGGVWWEGARLQVGFTADARWAGELSELLEQPDEVDMIEVAYAEGTLIAIQETIAREFANEYEAVGLGAQLVRVELRPDGASIAAELNRRYGIAVEVAVGGYPYPQTGADDPQPGPVATISRPDLELTAVPATDTVVGGQDPHGDVVITNRGPTTTKLDTNSRFFASLLDVDGMVAGSASGWFAGTGLMLRIGPGESGRVPFTGGTARPGPDYVTPPGVYQLVVVVPLFGPDHPRAQLVTPPVPLRVLPATA